LGRSNIKVESGRVEMVQAKGLVEQGRIEGHLGRRSNWVGLGRKAM